jgi:hypothetical protein
VKSTWGEIAVLAVEGGIPLVRHRPKVQDEGASIHFSPCGDFLVDGSWDGHIRVRGARDLSVEAQYSFDNEMIQEVAFDEASTHWLFVHQPKQDAPNQAPYLTLWTWPLKAPSSRIVLDFDTVFSAALAPNGRHIAVVGFSRITKVQELRLLTLSGQVVASVPVASGGTGSKTRWSRHSDMLATIVAQGLAFFEPPTLRAVGHIADRYPSDVAFLNTSTEVVVGSWNGGRIISFPTRFGDA